MTARSFCIPASTPAEILRPLGAVRSDVPSPSGGIVFVSGPLTQALGAIAEQLRVAFRGVPVTIVPGAGVLTERGEIESAGAVSGVLWSGGSASPLVLADASSTAALRETLANTVGERQATALLFARSDFSSELLSGLSAAAPRVCLLGAGTVGNPALVLTAAGERLAGRAVGLLIRGGAPPLCGAASACRLLASPRRIEATSDGLVLEVEGMSALDFLSASAADLPRSGTSSAQPLVLAALFDDSKGDGKGDGDGDRFVVRPVRGVDPGRGAIMIGADAQPGMRLSFAVRDAATAKANLDAMARKIAGQALGAAPEFALFLSCAGRGRGLYGAPDVEARLLRQRFPDVPIAGMHSSFEIVPWAPGEAKIALYAGVLALFRQPS